jgi:signal transduction histidine kinase
LKGVFLDHAAELRVRRRKLEATSDEMLMSICHQAASMFSKTAEYGYWTLVLMSHQGVLVIVPPTDAAGSAAASYSRLRMLFTQAILVSCAHELGYGHLVIRSMRNMVKKGQVTWELLDLNDVVTKAIRLANPDAMARGCQLSVRLEANLPKIRGVRIQLKQVLLNLMVNAFDAMQEVAPSQRVVVLSTGRDGEAGVRVGVRDFGVGLPAERERIFEQFFSTKRDGLGMGLVIARSIVEAHGGRLAAENVEGGGAFFHFILPAS